MDEIRTISVEKIRTILVEPQPLYLQGEIRDLEDAEDIEVIRTGVTGQHAIDLIETHHPDIAVIAMHMEGHSGLDVMNGLPDHKFLILSSEHSGEMIYQAMVQGACGYLLKTTHFRLSDAIRRAYAGEIVMCPEAMGLFVQNVRKRSTLHAHRERSVLSTREREILTLIARGHRQAEIAKQLGVQPTTVRTHCRNAYGKLGVKSQAAAIREALTRGLIEAM